MADEHDDDILATAARRAWADERAPADLRRAVFAQLNAHRHTRRRKWTAWGGAAAAVIAGAFGLGLLHRPTPTASPTPTAPSLLASLGPELVQTHDQCVAVADHQRLAVPRANRYAIAALLRSDLDRPVLVSRPADAEWRFAGASECRVGPTKAAHLVYRRPDGDTLSVFSLPRSVAPHAKDGQEFSATAAGHQIAGFVRPNAVYCLVASGCATDVSLPIVTDVCRQMERSVVVADPVRPAVVPPGGELIH